MSFAFEQKFPEDLPSSLPVFQLRPPPDARGADRALSELSGRLDRLGLVQEGAKTEASEDWTSRVQGPHDLRIHAASGALMYQNAERYQQQTDRPFEIGDDEAGRVAQEFLESTGIVPMEELRLIAVTHLEVGGGSPKGERAEVTLIDAGVVHGRVIKEVPVDGPGGHAMVNVDPEGQIVGIRIIWRPIADSIAEVKIMSPAVAYSAIERIAGRVKGEVSVTKASFGYFEQGVHDRQEFLQPAYSMVYTVTDGEVVYKSAEVVPASERVFEPLMGKKRFSMRAQKPRRKLAS